MAALTDRLYAAASTRDATSYPMIADLRKRTGAEASQMLHAALEPSDFDYLAQKASVSSDRIRIAYAGTITAAKTFVLFVKTLRVLRERLRKPLSLEFFGANSYAEEMWFDPSWMQEHGICLSLN